MSNVFITWFLHSVHST